MRLLSAPKYYFSLNKTSYYGWFFHDERFQKTAILTFFRIGFFYIANTLWSTLSSFLYAGDSAQETCEPIVCHKAKYLSYLESTI